MSTLRMGFTSGPLAGLAGADGPESKNFDPAKFAESSAEWIPFFREAELKHGRIAMLATAGYLVSLSTPNTPALYLVQFLNILPPSPLLTLGRGPGYYPP
jgi:hypothetical protein